MKNELLFKFLFSGHVRSKQMNVEHFHVAHATRYVTVQSGISGSLSPERNIPAQSWKILKLKDDACPNFLHEIVNIFLLEKSQ